MAVNGKIAVEMAMQRQYDAVLMDMQMPVMDGFEATRTLRAQGNQVPIIALTANAMAQDERKCRESGCTGFLPKPIKRQLLFATLAEIIDPTGEKRRMAAQTQNSEPPGSIVIVNTLPSPG